MWQPQRIMITVVIEIPRGMNVIILLSHKPLDSGIILDQTNFLEKVTLHLNIVNITFKCCSLSYSILEKNYVVYTVAVQPPIWFVKADLHSVPLFYIFVLLSSLSPRSAIWDQKKKKTSQAKQQTLRLL